MIITAANKNYADLFAQWKAAVKSFGYSYAVYDLGGLDEGIPFTVDDPNFQATGIYGDLLDDDQKVVRQTKALFKPSVVQDAMARFPKEQIIWLDCDAILQKAFDVLGDYDIGIVERPSSELLPGVYGDIAKMESLGKYNAGVIFFNQTDLAKAFVDSWVKDTETYMNDQTALNALVKGLDAIIKVFPPKYNSPKLDDDTIIYHLKGNK